jgi:predicted nucleic acid-binding Zn finger protein
LGIKDWRRSNSGIRSRICMVFLSCLFYIIYNSSCTCPYYTYRRSECKHILKVKEGFSAPRAGYVVHPMVREGVVRDREYQRRLVERLSILAGALESKG